MQENPYSQSKSFDLLGAPTVDELAWEPAGCGQHVVARLLVAIDCADHLGVGRPTALADGGRVGELVDVRVIVAGRVLGA